MSKAVSDFIAAMRDAGIGPADESEIQADDVRRRYRVEGDKRGTRNGAYVLREDADGFAVGWAASFKAGAGSISWHSKTKRKASDDEKREWRERLEAERARKEQQRVSEQEEAAKKASWIWDRSSVARELHPYLVRKGLDKWCGCRQRGDLLVVPVRTGDKLVGLQFIAENGEKRFLTNTAKDGAYHVLRGVDDVVAVCEGLATAATVRAATGWTAVVAFDAGNLVKVVRVVRDQWPDARIVICADNDSVEGEVLE